MLVYLFKHVFRFEWVFKIYSANLMRTGFSSRLSVLGCVQSRKKLAKLAFLVLGLVEWFTLAPPYRVMKIVKRLQHLHIEKIF